MIDCSLVVETFNCIDKITWSGLILFITVTPLVLGMLWVLFFCKEFY